MKKLLWLLFFPSIAFAQVGIAVNSYFGTAPNLVFVEARTLVTPGSIQGDIQFASPKGSVTIEVTNLKTSTVIRGGVYTNTADFNGWGYWVPYGTSQELPCLVTGQFTQSGNSVATVALQVVNYPSNSPLYSSGTYSKNGSNVIAIGVVTTPIIGPGVGGGVKPAPSPVVAK